MGNICIQQKEAAYKIQSSCGHLKLVKSLYNETELIA